MTTVSAPAARSRAAGMVRFVAAAVSALTVAAVGAALGAWLGWRGAPALPSDTAVLALLQPAVPEARLTVMARHDATFAYEHTPGPMTWLIGDDDYNAGAVELTTTTPLDTLRAGLAAEGWHHSDDPAYHGVAASKGAWSVHAYPARADGSPTDPHTAEAVAVAFGRAEPARVGPLTAAGYLLGLAAGWLLTHRANRYLLAAGLFLLLPGTVVTTGDLIVARTLPADITPPALWGDYLYFGIRALTTVGLFIMAVALPLGLLGARRRRAGSPHSRTAARR